MNMMKGRKPKPTHLKLIAGNPGKRAIGDSAPKPRISIPSPPDHLDAEAKAEWERVARELAPLGCIAEIDRAALAAYCQAYARWVHAERVIATLPGRGLVVRTEKGNMVINPLIGIANKAMADMVRYAAEFGMTPSARSRIDAERTRPEQDPAERYFPRKA